MRRAALLLTAFICASGCSLSSVDPFPGASPPPAIREPDPIDLNWRGFGIHLEPTVVLWARDARVDIRDVVRDAMTRIQSRLRGSPAAVYVQAGSFRVIPDVGIGGFTSPVSGEVKITMDQRSPVGLRRLLTVWLPLAMAHELHHSSRILDGPGYGVTLLEAMITEGGAEAFVRATFPDAPPVPWVRPLAPEQEAAVWERARDELDVPETPGRHEQWFFGSRDIPRWAGYRIGYAIARAYLDRHPDRSAADLAEVSANEVLSESGYDPGRS